MADEKNLEVLKVGVICPKMPTQLSKIEEEDQYCRMDLDIGLHYNSIGIYFDVIETIKDFFNKLKIFWCKRIMG